VSISPRASSSALRCRGFCLLGATAKARAQRLTHTAGVAQDLEENAAQYWTGMEALAGAGDHVYIKISMLCYTDKARRHGR
jgi:hypothetical protein